MSKSAWVAGTEAEVALAAGVAKTVLAGRAPADRMFTVVTWQVNFDGVTQLAEAVVVELLRGDQTGNGTSTAVTPRRKRGAAAAATSTTWGKNFTVEPTVLVALEPDWAVDAFKGIVALQMPLGREYEIYPAETFAIRCTAPAAVNVRAAVEFETG